MNKYSSVNAKPKSILINRPGELHTIDLSKYFVDSKQGITLGNSSYCGDLEFVLTDNLSATQGTVDFAEIDGNNLHFYCDWYTQETGTFDVYVAARLKWFKTELSQPVTFRVTLNSHCNKSALAVTTGVTPSVLVHSTTSESVNALLSLEPESDGRILEYGHVVLFFAIFAVTILVGAAIAASLLNAPSISDGPIDARQSKVAIS